MTMKFSAGDFVQMKSEALRDIYRVGQKIGEGSYSTVYSVVHKSTNETRTVKTILKKFLKTPEAQAAVLNEFNTLRSLDHPNIIKIYESFEDDQHFYFVTEYCAGGELYERLTSYGYISEAVAAEYLRQILSVLVYCHSRGIVHRDLKPENFLLDSQAEDANLKIIDFGSSAHISPGDVLRDKVGTPYYIAPEIVRPGTSYSEKCDVWSAGVNLYVLLCGYPPFTGSDDQEIQAKVATGRYSFPSPEWDEVSFEGKDLISLMMNPDPSARISAQEALSHPWISFANRKPVIESHARQVMINLRSFKSGLRLQKAMLSFISARLVSKNEREAMLEVFKSLDANNDGTLSKQELMMGFRRFVPAGVEDVEAEVEKVIREADLDLSGAIDYMEFVTGTINRGKLVSKERLRMCFDAFDIDGNGMISASELRALLGNAREYDETLWQEVLNEVDRNGDGVIDFEEFTAMMLNVID
jgi:calcium-dependent protein kinase